MSIVEFLLLGTVQIRDADGATVRLNRRMERLALAVLLLEPARVVTADRLIDLLWGQAPPPKARTTLHTVMSRVRSALRAANGCAAEHPEPLLTRSQGYLLQVSPGAVDLHRFRAMVGAAQAIGDPSLRSARLAAALELWRGPALADAATGGLRAQLCDGLDEERSAAICARVDAELAAGRHRELIPELSRLTAEHPLRERLHGQLMLALHRGGRRAEALAVYRRARRLLVVEMGLEPGPELRDLQAAIIADHGPSKPGNDHAIRIAAEPQFIRTVTSVVPAQLPPELTGFVGRTSSLRQLDAMLANGPDAGCRRSAMPICVIAGTAGIGKTALAVTWSHRVRHRFPDGQLHVKLHGFDPNGTATSPAEALRGFLHALQVPTRQIPDGLQAQTGLYRSLLADKRVLVLLDNARDAEQVRPLLPASTGCVVVVTSRSRLSSLVAVEGAHPLHVDLLSAAEAEQLLAGRLTPQRVAAEPEPAAQIVRYCARLPLALAVTAARAAIQPGLTLATIARELSAVADGLDAFEGDDTVNDIRAAFEWSYQALSVGGRRLFRMFGVDPTTDLTAAAAASLLGVPVRQARSLLTELAGAHLLVEGRPGRFAPHDLLRAYARELAGTHDPAAEQRAAAHRLLDYYLHNAHVANHLLYPNRPPIEPLVANATVVSDKLTDRRDALCWFGTEYSSLLAAVEYAAANDFDAHAWQLASTLWAYVRRGGYWRDKVAMHQAALGAAQRLKSPEARAHMHHGLATAYADMGRDEDAYAQLGLALEALPDAERSVLKADTHQGLSWICDRRGCYGEALEHARQALALFHRLGHRSGQASALNNVGWLHARLGDYARALALCGQALDIFREFEDHAYGADAWDSLGYTHHRLGDHEQAIAHYRHALELHREAGSRYCESRTLSRLGELLASGGDHLAAERALRRALDILCELAHPDADAVRATLESLPVAQGGVSSVAAGH